MNLSFLLLDSRRWVHRRVNTIVLDDGGSTRHSISLDVTPPAQFLIPGSKGRAVIPLGLLNKKTLRTFDITDATGQSLAVLGAEANGQFAFKMMEALAPESLRSHAHWEDSIRDALHRLVHSTEESADNNIKKFNSGLAAWRSSMTDLPTYEWEELGLFQSFAAGLARSFLLLAEIDSALANVRTVIKYSFAVDAPQIKGKNGVVDLRIEASDFGFAASQHFEFRVPSGVDLALTHVVERDLQSQAVQLNVDAIQIERSVSHVALSPLSRFNSALLTVWAHPSRQGIYVFTAVAYFLLTAAVIAGGLVKLHWLPLVSDAAVVPSPSASILLVGPALMLSWFARSPEHHLTKVILKPLRRALLWGAFIFLMLAVAAAVPLTSLVWNALWVVIGAVWLANVVVLARFYIANEIAFRDEGRE